MPLGLFGGFGGGLLGRRTGSCTGLPLGGRSGALGPALLLLEHLVGVGLLQVLHRLFGRPGQPD